MNATARCWTSRARRYRGLYAAGRTALGIPSHLYISGLSLADCVFSGRRAGAAVARPFMANNCNRPTHKR